MRHLGLVASAIAAGTGVVYIGFLIKQGTPVVSLNVVVVTAAIAALAVLTAYGSLGPNPTRRALALWAAVPGFFGLGYLAAFSIGRTVAHRRPPDRAGGGCVPARHFADAPGGRGMDGGDLARLGGCPGRSPAPAALS
jgi:hypothetical protein